MALSDTPTRPATRAPTTNSKARVALDNFFAAIVLDARLLQLAWRLRADPSPRNASSLFHYSLVFLALLFTAVAVDTLIP